MIWRNRWLIGLWVVTACGAQQNAPATSSAEPSSSAAKTVGSGALTADQIKTVVNEHGSDLRNCQGRARNMTNENFKGDVMIKWKIAPSGEVTEAEPVNPPPLGEILAKCLADSVKSWKFPAANGPSSVSRPFSF